MDGSSDKGAIRSEEFDDVYFSAQNGLEETRHVFLSGNGLPGLWQDAPQHDTSQFVIAETGFGTGLNFLATWDLFEQSAHPGQSLHFISCEKHPLPTSRIHEALHPWAEDFGEKLQLHLDNYPLLLPGFHRIDFSSRIQLTLIFDDVYDAWRKLEAKVDAWFLDGFKPSSNPDMWRDEVFKQMARLSHTDTRFATFTAAGFVKRGLQSAGFDVRKIKGFGRKREMLVGEFSAPPKDMEAP